MEEKKIFKVIIAGGRDFNIANNKLIAVNVFSPPDSNEILDSFLPGGHATISIPVSNIFSGSVNTKSALPPLNNSLNVNLKFSLIISLMILNHLIENYTK